jgi:acetylornithine deacetylase/succinyl-diaminopimelate desuccinylase-like protein
MDRPADIFVEQHRDRLLEELKDFLRIPSISTLPEHKPDIAAAAHFVANSLRHAGMEHVEIIPTAGNPLIYADWLHAPAGKPTVLCYGHYDVQPPDPLELWHSPPFEPAVHDGNIYARGSSDDKGQMYMHIKAAEALFAVHGGRLPVNLKFLIEGEEEIGGASISKFVAENQAKLNADVALVSDTQLYAEGLPTLCIGLRGLVYMELEATGPDRDLHSGLYGGAAPNPIHGLIELLCKCKDTTGSIRIPGMYEDVAPPAAAERESWKRLPFDEAEFLRKEVGATELVGEAGYSVLERVWARPTMEVHGIAGGFTGTGSKTVIPSKAVAKISFRLVPNQDPAKILKSFGDFLQFNSAPGIKIELRVLGAAPAVMVDPDHPAIRVASEAFSDMLGKPTVLTRNGGSIPVVGDFANHLKIPTVLMGFGLPDDGLHSPNEKYSIGNYYTGIMTIALFFERMGERIQVWKYDASTG